MLQIKQRRVELDIARSFAIICVLLCHATESIYLLNKNGWARLSNQSRIFMIVSFTIGRLGVPIFLFLTGALILKKSFETDDDVFKFYKKNLASLIITNSIWIVIYNIYFLINNQKDIVTNEFIIKELLLIKQVPLKHMWYFPVIIGLYIGLPFVSKIIKTFSKKALSILMVLIFISAFVLPMINVILAIIGIKDAYVSLLNISFLGGAYGLYVVVGYFLDSRSEHNRKTSIFIVMISILCFIITCLFQMLSYSKLSKKIDVYNVWYNFPFLLVCVAGIFKIIVNIDTSKMNEKIVSFFTFISKTSLATFFLHIIIINIITPHIASLKMMMPMKVVLLAGSTFLICVILESLLCKVKIVSKYVMLMEK